MQQHGVPLVRQIAITNGTQDPVVDARVSLQIANGEAPIWERVVARIGANETYHLTPDAFRLDGKRLSERTEAERSEIQVQLTCGAESTSRSYPVDLLAYDEWPGTRVAPELLSAFITPNHPAIADVLRAARPRLAELSGSDAFDGYQSSNRGRAVHIAAACFDAVAELRLGYINPPASFEQVGQRVRLADRVLRESLATCLDLSLFLAAVWEQAGLHPLVILLPDHALPAVWTLNRAFDPAVLGEVARLRNHIELGAIVPVESTVLTHTNKRFAEAVAAAKNKLADAKGDTLIIDVYGTRKLGVRPLPLRFEHGVANVDHELLTPSGQASESTAVKTTIETAERAEKSSTRSSAGQADSPKNRLERWKRKLLDLSLRNRLLSFKESGRVVSLSISDLGALEDGLADGQAYEVLPHVSHDREFLSKQLEAHKLHSTSGEGALGKKMLDLYRLSRSSIEETGANLLHLALGTLVWFESESSEQARRAPLILLPITITRRSTGSGYTFSISLSEEPLRPNITLLEKLKNDFGIDCAGLDEFPEDETGIDVPLILHRFRDAIRATKRWEVEDSASIGLFSFNKFLMWRDLHLHAERLRESRVVGHLVGSRNDTFDSDPFPDPRELDHSCAPGDLLCTRDADSSQLAAVFSASQNRTFVLQGPPGTGKSQTIANIIAHSVGKGRRVLFVAEKMAALSVVRRRLEQDGLGPACLELHSAKASKKEVLDQLRKAIESNAVRHPADWKLLCADLASDRASLNAYVRELHLPRATGESLYKVMGRLALLGEGPTAPCPVLKPSSVSEAQLRAWRDQIVLLVNAARQVNPIAVHPFRLVHRTDWSFGLPDQVKEGITRSQHCLARLQNAIRQWTRVASAFELETASSSVIQELSTAAALLQTRSCSSAAMLTQPGWTDAIPVLERTVALGRERQAKLTSLTTHVHPEWLCQDLLKQLDIAKRAKAKPPVFRWFASRNLVKSLRHLIKDPSPTIDTIISYLGEAQTIRTRTEELKQGSDGVIKWLGEARWNGGDADWNAIERDLTWVVRYRPLLDSLRSSDPTSSLPEVLAAEAVASDLAPSAAVANAWLGWKDAWNALVALLCIDEEALRQDVSNSGWLPSMRTRLDQWLVQIASLNDWVTWRQIQDATTRAGLESLVVLIEESGITPDRISGAFERGFGTKWLPEVADTVSVMRGFNLGTHLHTLERFGKADTRLIELTGQLVAAEVAAHAPGASSPAAPSSEMGILKRELGKKRKHIPTRKLVEALPTLLPRLKPCFLMSPLSVAQYLDARLPQFDLVVFDEASQIPVWDAIGALARGQDAIVVGDSKQLPPTAFFSTLDSDDGEPEQDIPEDLESILQECEASGIPTMRLRWHYRSRHESLIAFSNFHYYNNALQTFPSPIERSEELGVTLRYVPNGVYDKGQSRTNRVEAQAVVDEVFRRLKRGKEHASIGVVTFSQAQQVLIEDLLDAARREHPDIEPFFNEGFEPVFVKNLENVQGDERDTIIFSVCYGRDPAGKMTHNFGPINQNGGERRLNVAITRARQRLIVFSSIKSDDIDLGRTQAVGVHHFKRFLDFADRGPKALAEALELTRNGEFDSGFERAVFDALTARGWRLDTQVGCSGFRIDLAVIHPELPGRYVLGIECDGASYHSAQTARDRDRLRAEILRGLGWQLVRVWSTDWRIDPRRCIEVIERAINAALLALKNPKPPEPETAPAVEPSTSSPPQQSLFQSFVGPAESQKDSAGEHCRDADPIPTYRVAHPPRSIPTGRELGDQESTQLAVECLIHIVKTEYPTTPSVAQRRLANWFRVKRVTDKAQQRLDDLVALAIGLKHIRRHGDALWPSDVDPTSYDGFRLPGSGKEVQRDVEDVPLVERVAAAHHVLSTQFGMPREELEREVARLFGAGRVTDRIQLATREAVDSLVAQGRAIVTDGKISLPQP